MLTVGIHKNLPKNIATKLYRLISATLYTVKGTYGYLWRKTVIQVSQCQKVSKHFLDFQHIYPKYPETANFYGWISY